MANLKFNTTKTQKWRDLGGEHIAVHVGKCGLCRRSVYQQGDLAVENQEIAPGRLYDPDPRGAIVPEHAAASLVAEEYGAQDKAPDALFCWDCLWEHGKERYDACLAIAERLWGAS